MAFRSDLESLILGSLSKGPQHGYGIVKSIRATSEDVLKLGEAQLYPVLHRLEQGGDIKGEWVPIEGKPPRKVYAITSQGEKSLKRRRAEWSNFKDAVSRVLEPNFQSGDQS